MHPLTTSFCTSAATIDRLNESHPLAHEAWDMQPSCVVGVGFEDRIGAVEMVAIVQHVGVNLEPGQRFCAIGLVDLPLAVAARLLGLAAAALLYEQCKLDIQQDSRRGMMAMCREMAAELCGMVSLAAARRGWLAPRPPQRSRTFSCAQWTYCEDNLDSGEIPAKTVSNQNVFINWLPFTEEEAHTLAFGTRLSVDALPAFVLAVRLHHPDDSTFEAPPLGDSLALV